MTTSTDAADAGRLIGWAARPREIPSRHEDYQRLVARYLDEPDFAALAESFAAGAGLDLVVNARDGVIATAEADSPFRYTTSDVTRRIADPHRSVIGAVLLAVARTAYPEPIDIEDPDRVATFTTKQVVDVLDRAAQRLSDSSSDDGDLDESQVEVWRRWLALAEIRPNAERRSMRDRGGITQKVCQFLVEAGYLTKRGDLDGGTWTSRPRFRHAVAALTEDSDLYQLVAGLDEDPPTDAHGAGR